MKNLKDHVIVITGASRGIGAEMARAFAKEGCKMLLCGRDLGDLDKVANSTGLSGSDVNVISTDIRTAEGMKEIVDTAYNVFGRVDVFINNAGVGYKGSGADTTEKEYDTTFDTNVKAVFFSFKELIPRMKAQGGGQIINVSSMAGKQGVAAIAVYASSKAALNVLSDSVALEVRNDNIKIGILAPGTVLTEFGGMPLEQRAQQPHLMVADVADAAVYLAKQDDNAWVSNVEMRPLIVKKP